MSGRRPRRARWRDRPDAPAVCRHHRSRGPGHLPAVDVERPLSAEVANGLLETDWLFQWPEQGPTIAWKASVGTGFSSVTVADGRLYTMGNRSNIDTVYCLDAVTGKGDAAAR